MTTIRRNRHYDHTHKAQTLCVGEMGALTSICWQVKSTPLLDVLEISESSLDFVQHVLIGRDQPQRFGALRKQASHFSAGIDARIIRTIAL